jgi:hypothetical protein
VARVISFFGSRVKKTVDQLYRSTSFKKKERNFLCVVREGSMNDLSGSFPFINQDGNSFSRIQSVHPLVSLFHKQEKIFQPTQRCQDGKDWQSFKKKIENFCCAKKKRKDFCYSQRYSTPAVGELPTLTREQRTSHGDEDRSITDARGP